MSWLGFDYYCLKSAAVSYMQPSLQCLGTFLAKMWSLAIRILYTMHGVNFTQGEFLLTTWQAAYL